MCLGLSARATHARSSLLERREETDTGRAELSGWYAGSVRGARWRHWTLHCSIPGHWSLLAAGETLFLWPVFTIHIYRHTASAQPGLGLLLTINSWSGGGCSVLTAHTNYESLLQPLNSLHTTNLETWNYPRRGRMMNSNKNLEEWERETPGGCRQLSGLLAIIARDTRGIVTHIAKATRG